MLIVGIVAVVIVVGVLMAVVVLRRTHDDEHSVALYHRSLHTLEEMREHPHDAESGANGNGGDATHPASAFRVPGSSAVRLTERGRTVVPPVPPPPMADPSGRLRFDDATVAPEGVGPPGPAGGREGAEDSASAAGGGGAGTIAIPGRPRTAPAGVVGAGAAIGAEDAEGGDADGTEDVEPLPDTFMRPSGDRVMHSVDRRPARLAARAAAIGAVTVLIIVLVVAGMHSNTPTRHSGSGTVTSTHTTHTTATTSAPHRHHGGAVTTRSSTTTTAAPPIVSAPAAASARAATYQVAAASYTLTLAATSGPCWVQATDATNGTVLYSATLSPGQSHAIAATGPLTVTAGAPNTFSATVDGTAVALPPGFQAPFTLTFRTSAT